MEWVYIRTVGIGVKKNGLKGKLRRSQGRREWQEINICRECMIERKDLNINETKSIIEFS